MTYSCGLDWGDAKHTFCVVDAKGKAVLQLEVDHNTAGLAELRKNLDQLAQPQDLPVAIERPSGLIVDALVEAGHPVVPMHPNAVKACRPRYRAAGGKSDPGDAFILADILRTDGHRFQPLQPFSDAIKALRALVRGRDDLVAQRVAMANQLRSLLDSFWPGAAHIFADVDSRIALAFLNRYPTPKAAAHLGEKRLKAFLDKHGYSGRRSAAELLKRLRSAPTGLAAEAEAQEKGETVQSLVSVLNNLIAQITKLTKRIEQKMANMADGQIIMSFPRAGRICAAQILAEIGNVRERFPTADHLAAEAGVCLVTYASGKRRGVSFRRACNHRLRYAITTFADNSRHTSRWAASVYKNARARGCDHPHAVRILARAWIRILWRAWQNHVSYDPNAHNAAVKLSQTSEG